MAAFCRERLLKPSQQSEAGRHKITQTGPRVVMIIYIIKKKKNDARGKGRRVLLG